MYLVYILHQHQEQCDIPSVPPGPCCEQFPGHILAAASEASILAPRHLNWNSEPSTSTIYFDMQRCSILCAALFHLPGLPAAQKNMGIRVRIVLYWSNAFYVSLVKDGQYCDKIAVIKPGCSCILRPGLQRKPMETRGCRRCWLRFAALEKLTMERARMSADLLCLLLILSC